MESERISPVDAGAALAYCGFHFYNYVSYGKMDALFLASDLQMACGNAVHAPARASF